MQSFAREQIEQPGMDKFCSSKFEKGNHELTLTFEAQDENMNLDVNDAVPDKMAIVKN